MSILEQITQMKSQGKRDEEIINVLRQQNLSPREINDALSQLEIKNAVSGSMENHEKEASEEYYSPSTNEPSPQIPQTPQLEPSPEYPNSPQEYSQSNQQQEFYPQEGYGAYDNYNNYAPANFEENSGRNSNTMMEIAEQVFSEKIKKTQKSLNEIKEFKTLTETKIDNFAERLKKIETIIDRLQITILEKIGSYGSNLEGIKKEMSMMQDSFGKIINPLLDKESETKHRPHHKHSTHTGKKKGYGKK